MRSQRIGKTVVLALVSLAVMFLVSKEDWAGIKEMPAVLKPILVVFGAIAWAFCLGRGGGLSQFPSWMHILWLICFQMSVGLLAVLEMNSALAARTLLLLTGQVGPAIGIAVLFCPGISDSWRRRRTQ